MADRLSAAHREGLLAVAAGLSDLAVAIREVGVTTSHPDNEGTRSDRLQP
jgi:hypothetical protein